MRAGLEREAALLLAMDTAGRTVFFAGCTVIIALLGLLLLGLSFLHGAAVACGGRGAADDVRRADPAARAAQPVGQLDRPAAPAAAGPEAPPGRGARPARSRRACRARARPGRAGRSAVQRRPWAAIAVSLLILLGLALPALHMRLGTVRRRPGPRGHDDAQGLRPHRRRLRRGHERVVPARRRATRARATTAARDRGRGGRRRAIPTSPSVTPPQLSQGRRDRDDRRCSRRAARRTRRRRSCSIDCATTSCRPSSRRRAPRSTSAARSPRRRTSPSVIAQQAAALRRHGRAAQRAAADGGVPQRLHPDQGGVHEPAVDRRGARLPDARLPGRLPRRRARRRHGADRVVRARDDRSRSSSA